MNVNLRKSDKLIAIIGVIILIVAGIGIFLYANMEDNEEIPDVPTDETMFYVVDSKIVTASLLEKSQTIKQKLFGEQTVSFKKGVMADNVINISVSVRFTDNNPGLLGKLGIGKDTLTVSVFDSEGNKVDSKSKKGSGKIEIKIDRHVTEIYDPIEAKSYEEAEQILMDQYEQFQENYTIKVSLDGKLFGAIREKLKGDSFKLEVTYCYYDYTLEEPNDGDGQLLDDFTEEHVEESGAVGEFYKNLCYGRGVI